MVQMGTPEQYFGPAEQKVVVSEIPPIQAKVVEPVEVRYVYSQQGAPTDYTPLIICVCFLGTVCFLAFLAWTWGK